MEKITLGFNVKLFSGIVIGLWAVIQCMGAYILRQWQKKFDDNTYSIVHNRDNIVEMKEKIAAIEARCDERGKNEKS